MNEQLALVWQNITAYLLQFEQSLTDPMRSYQFGLLGVVYVLSWLAGRKIEPRWEERARNISGNPALLRVLITLLRRTQWIVFIVLLGFCLLIIRANQLNLNTRLLESGLLLSLAWIGIKVATQSIHSRPLRQLLAVCIWFYVALLILDLSDDLASLLDLAGFAIGGTRVSLLLFLKVLIIIVVALTLAVWSGNLIDVRIQKNEELDPGLRLLIGKVLKISLIFLALIIAVSGIGIDLTVFSVLSGAIGVGIGFGLQKVVSNFISGLIILADRSIKPGDTISLGETFGWIRELRARFVSVVTRDGREYLIPNEDFITREVINWSFSDELVRLDVRFGVSYDSDPHEVTRLAIEAAEGIFRVQSSRKPVCWMTDFGDSSIDFILRFWIRDPQNGLTNIRGQVLIALWDTFKLNNVTIPYPHREHIFKNQLEVVSPDKSVED